MEKLVRAKFRVLQVIQTWDGNTVVKLGPVKRGKQDAENDFFWKYTPSGEAEICFTKTKGRITDNPFKVGAFYFLDFSRGNAPQATWRLNGIDQQDSTVTVTFYGQENHVMGSLSMWASVRMGLSGEAHGAREMIQPHGSLWNITFTFAEDSDV